MESYSGENPNGISKEVSDESEILLGDNKKNPNLRFRSKGRNPPEDEFARLDHLAQQEGWWWKARSEGKVTTAMRIRLHRPVSRPASTDHIGHISNDTAEDIERQSAQGELKPGFSDKYKRRAVALIFFVLETISFILDVVGKNQWSFLLPALILSLFGFATVGIKTKAETQIGVLEIVFSVVQLIVSSIYLILSIVHVQNNFSASLFPLVFAIVLVVFAFQNDREKDRNSSRYTNGASSPGYPVNSTDEATNNSAEDVREEDHENDPIDSQGTTRNVWDQVVTSDGIEAYREEISSLESTETSSTSEVTAAPENKNASNITARSVDSSPVWHMGSTRSQLSRKALEGEEA